jgi:glutathione S-transferase
MKLYYAKFPHSSLPVHIVLEELGLKYESQRIDLDKDPTPEFLKLNPVGGVPILELDSGESLTEIAAILQYLADKSPEAKLAPPFGSMERYRLQEWLHFIGTEIHKGFWPFGFIQRMSTNPSGAQELQQLVLENLELKMEVVAKKLGSQSYALSSGYSVVDPYLYTILSWAQGVGLDLVRWPTLHSYVRRISSRPAVVTALKLANLGIVERSV